MNRDDFKPSDEYQSSEKVGVHSDNPLTVKPEHIKLLRNMRTRWGTGEFGAPAIDSKRPYGNSDVINDIREVTEMPNANEEWCKQIHREMEAILQFYLSNEGELGAGDQIIYENYEWVKYDG